MSSVIHPLMRPGARHCMSIEPPFRVRHPAFEWDHEVQVALPAAYAVSEGATYPVLWLTDGAAFLHLTVGILNCLIAGSWAPEVIVVSVGCPEDVGMAELVRRRNTEYSQGGELFHDGPGGDFFRAQVAKWPEAMRVNIPTGKKADDFLSLFVDRLRPELSRKYRMSDDHALFGHSGGGQFAGYAMFARPEAFRRYIIGSPSINANNREAFRLEAEYAARVKDLKISAFFGAGENEINANPLLAAWGIVSAPVLMAETLTLRQYPSLSIKTRIFHNRDHLDVIPELITEGIKFIWSREAAALPRS